MEILFQFLTSFGVIILALLVLASSAIKVVQEYDTASFSGWAGWSAPKAPACSSSSRLDRMVKVDLRVVTLDIPSQEAITRDNVTVKVNAVAYFRAG